MTDRDKTVLVIEDEETVRKLTVRILNKLGYMTVTACDGCEAIEIFQEQANNIDAAIVDMFMPRMNGPDTIMGLKQIKPDLPVLLVTGFGWDQQMKEMVAFDENAVSLLNKPYTLKKLETKLRELLS